MYHARRLLAPVALRHSFIIHRSINPPPSLRTFATTPRAQASETEDAFLSKLKTTTMFQKIADKPEALAAISNFAQLLQKNGM